jgi:hypothetical protein
MANQALNAIGGLLSDHPQKRMKVLLVLLIVAASVTVPSSQRENPSIAVHPSDHLDPDGQWVTVIGKGFPPTSMVQLSQCTDLPLNCLVLMDVNTNEHGMFVTRLVVAFDFGVLTPFPPTPTCSEPTFSGDTCLLFAVSWSAPVAAFEPIAFRE